MLEIKYTKHFLGKLEEIFVESDYTLRYEKGNFKSGFCLINDQRVAIVNRYFPTEGRINCLLEILRQVAIDPTSLSPKSRELLASITQTQLEL